MDPGIRAARARRAAGEIPRVRSPEMDPVPDLPGRWGWEDNGLVAPRKELWQNCTLHPGIRQCATYPDERTPWNTEF